MQCLDESIFFDKTKYIFFDIYKFEFATFKTIMTIPYPHERANIHHALFLLVSNLFEKKMLGA